MVATHEDLVNPAKAYQPMASSGPLKTAGILVGIEGPYGGVS